MPTNRSRRRRTQVTSSGITEADYIYFTWGAFFEAENYEDRKTKDDLKAFWKAHRTAIMERYNAEEKAQRHFGHRPWPIWKWELTEPRLITEANNFKSMKVWDRQRQVYDWVETDLEYLKRLGLLEAWELEHLETTATNG